jgi:hypothetical protein
MGGNGSSCGLGMVLRVDNHFCCILQRDDELETHLPSSSSDTNLTLLIMIKSVLAILHDCELRKLDNANGGID